MRHCVDILMFIITTTIMLGSLKNVVKYKSHTLTDFCILLLYIFQCVPVLCDILIGVPQYASWYSGFENALNNDSVCIVYDIYILALFLSLSYLSKVQNKKYMFYNENGIVEDIDNARMSSVPSWALGIIIVSPFIHVLLSGNFSAFAIYASYGARGLESDFTTLNANLIIISIIAFFVWYFRKDSSVARIILMIAYSLLIIWISGKRYTVITVIYCFVYMYTLFKNNKRKKLNLGFLFMVIVIGVVLYSAYYITTVKVLSDGSFQSTYSALRIDFGRDDVVKYTIMTEYFDGKRILEYPLETIISTIFMIVPRSVFPNKPYPHYRYLTASLFNTNIYSIPAGMTPTILEMMISNFRWLGMPLCILFICWYCKKADSSKNKTQKLVYSLILMGLLSQSMDAMMFLFYLVLYYIFTSKVKLTIGKYKLY